MRIEVLADADAVARKAAALIAAHIAPMGAGAEPFRADIGSLSGLFLPHQGKLVQYSSRAREHGQIDGWEVPPGRTVTLVDHKGAGIVRRWWMTVIQHERTELLFRNIILRCYWDGEAEPSVEAPLSDFFGLGFGEWRDYVLRLDTSDVAARWRCGNVRQLRFDPIDQPGIIELGRMELR